MISVNYSVSIEDSVLIKTGELPCFLHEGMYVSFGSGKQRLEFRVNEVIWHDRNSVLDVDIESAAKMGTPAERLHESVQLHRDLGFFKVKESD